MCLRGGVVPRSAAQLQLRRQWDNVSSTRRHCLQFVHNSFVRREFQRSVSPDEVAAASLQTLGDEDTPEMKAIQEVAAQGIPVGVEQCQQFVARCEKRVAAVDAERSRELERLEEGKVNLDRLRQIVTSVPPDSSSELEQLRLQVAQLQHELGQVGEAPCAKRQAVVPQARAVRLREDFVPMCDADILQWMLDRQADLQDASRMENVSEATRLCHVIAETASRISQSADLPSMATNFTSTGQ